MGHVAVGVLVGRAYEARSPRERVIVMSGLGALALLPDLDVLGVALGLEDHGHYGHRGYSHSLLFAAAVATLVGVIARRWTARPVFLAVLAFFALLSHGLMDAMTYRTRGIPFFWPFDDIRVKFPWRPIPPAPRGTDYLSLRGLQVAAVEIVYFLPVMIMSFMPSPARWRRWCQAIAARLRGQVVTATPAPVPAPSVHRDVFRLAAVITTVALCLAAAQTYLRDSRVVAWIERSTEESVAVSLARRVPQRLH